MEVMDHIEPELFPVLSESQFCSHLDAHTSTEIKIFTYIKIAIYIDVFRIET